MRCMSLACVTAIAVLVAGCPSPSEPDQARWQLPLSGLSGALLSASGTSATDIYAVGSDPGGGPLVVHYDGATWRSLDTGATGDLWWITDRPVDGRFFLVGQDGLALMYTPASGTFQKLDTPGGVTLFGVWGLSADNVIAVGGDPDEIDTSGVIWRYDGTQWTADDLSGISASGVPVLWKVWGRSNADVYVVGERGTILHYDGAQWTQLASPTTRTLFTVHGSASRVVACGGRTSGVIVELVGGAFQDVTPAGALQMNGTYVPSDADAVTVGLEGAIAFGGESGWALGDTGLTLDVNVSYHAAWVDPDGGIWAVGGNVFVDPAADGVLAYYGAATVGTQFVSD